MIGDLYADALATGSALEVEYADGHRARVPVDSWTGAPRAGDWSLIDRCAGPTLDVGCGPGRFVEALGRRGVPALGIDVTDVAVEQTRGRGGLALRRDVFGAVVGAGRWSVTLLADGNIGIGGDPVRLLRRITELLADEGHALVELCGPESGRGAMAIRLRTRTDRGRWFRWAEVGLADLGQVAQRAGMSVTEVWTEADRWFARLTHA
jgi:SAM-dependent methyltransferase